MEFNDSGRSGNLRNPGVKVQGFEEERRRYDHVRSSARSSEVRSVSRCTGLLI
jgi:hypothetical protein